MNRRLALGLLLAVFAAALALRLPDAGVRPLHNDEAVNATKLATLLTEGRYAYDPHEYHGPTLHYFSLPLLWLMGVHTADGLTDARLRWVTIAFGAALVFVLAGFADGLGWPAVIVAAVLTAVSPAMVFYSRYFIHEMLLVCFTAIWLVAGWRWSQSRRNPWACVAGVAWGLMYATKETFPIPSLALALALVASLIWEKWFPAEGSVHAFWQGWRAWGKPALLGLGLAMLVGGAFFTSFGRNWHGPLDSLATYAPWADRAGGASPHLHPWYFYFQRLFWFHPARSPVWSEGLVGVLAILGAGAALAGRDLAGANVRLARVLTFFSLAMVCGYTLLSYKTPWCLLGFWQPMILLAGLGAVVLFRWACRWGKAAAWAGGVALVAATSQLTWQGWRLNHEFAADRRNPYAYSQTLPDVRELVTRVLGVAKTHAEGTNMLVKVVSAESYWPLPWYLRDLQQVGWYEALPSDPFAPVVIASTRVGAGLDEKSGRKWIMAGMTALRPGVYLELYVDFSLWKRYVESLPREAD